MGLHLFGQIENIHHVGGCSSGVATDTAKALHIKYDVANGLIGRGWNIDGNRLI